MSHTYDLLLQPAETGAPFAVGPVDEALAARGAQRRGDGAWVWSFPQGEVVGLPLREGELVRAFELKIPLQDTPALVGEVLRAAAELAEVLAVKLIDPQLNHAVTAASEGAVADEYLKQARYAGEYLGVGSALGATTLATPPPDSSNQALRLLLALLVFAVCCSSPFAR